ncbi:hypothetical protein GCM10027592_12740 [Spirosoma flavus]
MNNVTTSTIAEVKTSKSRYSACLLFSANALSRAITVIGDEEFGRFGLCYSHAYMLCEVVEQPGITPSELSESLCLTPSTITRLVEKLEQKRLVRRESEGKKTLIYPTAEGEAIQPEIAQAWDRVGARYSQVLGETTVCQLTKQVFSAAKALGEGI